MTSKFGKIFARNLTAKAAAYPVPGNPTSSRPEDVVANCFPGLEVDVRNLDRRFFPGLVFDFVQPDNLYGGGAQLSFLDPLRDPDLQGDEPSARALLAALTDENMEDELAGGVWFLEWIEQGGHRISMYEAGATRRTKDTALDAHKVWRIVRSLDPDIKPVIIALKRRDKRAAPVRFEGWRRRYTDPETGVINGAYQPGELMQSLCSPWQHDFEECLCQYWASNHPDIVFGEVLPGERILPDGAPQNPEQANTRLDWLRSNRSRSMAAAALSTNAANRPFRMDHHEINHRWEQLNVVIGGREVGARYEPRMLVPALPLASSEDLVVMVRDVLAPLEMALAVEYLYARFSVLSPKEAARKSRDWPALAEDVTFVRQELMLIAVSEMQHLHWANQVLWQLYKADLTPNFEPRLVQASDIPDVDRKTRPHKLQRLDPKALQQLINVEHPSALIDGAYASVIATLRRDTHIYPPHLIALVERIAMDGMHHESRLLHIQSRLRTYASAGEAYPYLRDLRVGSRKETSAACLKFSAILKNLDLTYRAFSSGGDGYLARARADMDGLLKVGERLAEKKNLGIPFWPWPS